jgi:uncharacterized protein (TIGR02996 family)
MPTEDDLLAGIVAHPTQTDRWLVLADWLEDQGDPRAELARLRWQLHAEPDHPEREQRATRQMRLLKDLDPVVPAWTNSLGARFALILSGSFWMGSPTDEAGRYDDEVHQRVTLAEPFFLGTSAVTVGEFERFVTDTGYQTDAERGDGASGYINEGWRRDGSINWRNPGFEQGAQHPVVCVSWNDVQVLIAWLNRTVASPGQVYSMPTEAQWEYACRAGSQTVYFWGNSTKPMENYAWFISNSDKKTYPRETKKPNPWGLYHMTGNVWEWCENWYAENNGRAIRGGSWYVPPRECRSARRCRCDASARFSSYGVRLALAARPTPAPAG